MPQKNTSRVKFPEGKQRAFFEKIMSALSIAEVAKICHVCPRTIRDWRREKFLMNLLALETLCRKINLSFPKNIALKDRYWYTSNGSSAGGLAVFKKYGVVGGNPEHRKKKWYEWWKREGRYRKHPVIGISKPIYKPIFSTILAEFVGIVLGDGGISKRQVTVSLHSIDDKEYAQYVVALIRKLFRVPVSIRPDKNVKVVDLVISRTELVKFCVKRLGLKIGNKVKQQVDIPPWIKQKRGYLNACIRGLVDTDGSVFYHRYKVNGRWYRYKKISFSNRSKPLIDSVFGALRKFGMNPRITKDKWSVRLESARDVNHYFLTIGTHNSKCLKKYED